MLKPEELRYRLGRGGVWHVVTVCTQTDKFADNAHGFYCGSVDAPVAG